MLGGTNLWPAQTRPFARNNGLTASRGQPWEAWTAPRRGRPAVSWEVFVASAKRSWTRRSPNKSSPIFALVCHTRSALALSWRHPRHCGHRAADSSHALSQNVCLLQNAFPLQDAEKERMGFDVRKTGKEHRAPTEGDKDVAGEDISLVESGACGAFVHGLEDEFEAVRFAAIGTGLPLAPPSRRPR